MIVSKTKAAFRIVLLADPVAGAWDRNTLQEFIYLSNFALPDAKYFKHGNLNKVWVVALNPHPMLVLPKHEQISLSSRLNRS